jgi:hypothetical protein
VKIFLYTVATFLLMICHPLMISIRYGGDRSAAWRWIKNDLASHLFLLFVFPFAVGAFFQTANLRNATRALGSSGAALAWLLLAAIELLAAWFVYVDVTNPDRFISPHQLADDAACKKATTYHADKLREIADYEANDTRTNKERCTRIAVAQEGYRQITRRLFDSGGSLIPHSGSITFYSEGLFTLIAVWFAFLFFWFLGVLLWARRLGYTPSADQSDNLVLVCCLLMIFFPTRLYTEWYLAFFSLKFFRTYPGFWVLLVLACFALILLVFVSKLGLTVQTLAGVEAVFAAAGAFIGWWKPEWLRAVGRWFVNAQTQWILALGVITVLFLLAVTALIGHASPANPKAGS